MQTLAHIKGLLSERGLSPKRSLGQNFLIDHNLIRRLVDSSGVGAGDLVLEVGPGTGALTEELLERRCTVVACELDDALTALLRETMPHADGGEGFRLVHGDCLDGKHALAPGVLKELRAARDVGWGMSDVGCERQEADKPSAIRHQPSAIPVPPSAIRHPPSAISFTLVSNLPYGAGTPLITTLLLNHPECATLAVTIQREVADRLAARPGTKEYGGLAVVAQAIADVERIAKLPPECFWPRPEVTSAMVLLKRRKAPLTSDPRGLSEWCRILFAQRRKQLGAIIGRGGAAGVRPEQRAEELGVEEIIALGRALGRLETSGSTPGRADDTL